MDVRQLLLLAGDNSALAKKKVDRLDATADNDEPKISRDSVAAYLAKKKQFQAKLKAEEEEARKKRVQARLDASLGKPTRKEKKIAEKEKAAVGKFLPGDKRTIEVLKEKEKEVKKKEKEDKDEKIKTDKSKSKHNHKRRSESPENHERVKSDKSRSKHNHKGRSESPENYEKTKSDKSKSKHSHKRRSESPEGHQKIRTDKSKSRHKQREESPECPSPKKKVKTDKEKSTSKSESKKIKEKEKIVENNNENTHRKYKRRTGDRFESSIEEDKLREKEKIAREAKENIVNKKVSKNVSKAPPSMSFSDLLKLAKTNAATTQLSEDGTILKKKEKTKTFDEEYGNPVVSKLKDDPPRDIQKKSKSKDEYQEASRDKHKKSKYDDEFDEPPPKSKHVNGTDKHKKSRYEDEFDEPPAKSKHVNGTDNHKKVKSRNEFTDGTDRNKKSKPRDEFDEPPSKSKLTNGTDYNQSKKSVKDTSIHDKTGKNKVQSSSSRHEREQNDMHSSKHKHDMNHAKSSKVKDSVKENKYREDSPPLKRGLTSQTISTKKNGSLEPRGDISKVFKQVKPGRSTGIEAQYKHIKPSGIEAQFMKKGGRSNKPKLKQPAKKHDGDMDDEFEKEARMLAKKRKLFELKRVTGDTNLDEADIESDYEEYDLDEESESDDNFIDDSEPVGDVSKFIRRITGYDSRIYDDSEDDDHNMESSYSQIEKEEARSARIAKEEDRIAALEEAEELSREKAKELARTKKKR